MKLLSVIVPIYNTEKYLKECLESLVNQTYKNIEIICVNDGSTDNSLTILEEFAQKDSRIKIINQKNKGQSEARNAGLKIAQGEFITFIDSDDFIEPATYETTLKYIDSVDVVCFGVKVFGDSGYANRNVDNEYYRIKYSGKQCLNNKILMRTDCSVCNKILKKDIIEKYHLTFPSGLHYEDAEFYFKYMIVSNNAYFIKDCFYNYRRRTNSIMHQTFESCPFVIEHLYIVNNLYKFLQDLDIFYNKESLFIEIFKAFFSFAFDRAVEKQKVEVISLANIYANEFQFSKNVKSNFLKSLKNGKYDDIYEPDLTFWQNIFSIKNVWMPLSQIKKKNIVILGIKFKFTNKANKYKQEIAKLNKKVEDLNNVIQKQNQKINELKNLIMEFSTDNNFSEYAPERNEQMNQEDNFENCRISR